MARYAVRLSDLLVLYQWNPGLCEILFSDILQSDSVVCVDREAVDGYAAVLHCSDERAEVLVEVCQRGRLVKKTGHPMRFYVEGPEGGWSLVRPKPKPKKGRKEVQDGR